MAASQYSPRRRVIAIANGKGGVGKTTTTANLAGLCAAAGERVLAIDLDPQANLGEDLGYTRDRSDNGKALSTNIMVGKPLEPLRDVRPNLDCIPAGDELSDLVAWLEARRVRLGDAGVSQLLLNSLAPIADDYTLIFIDTPPNQRALQQLALGAARWVLIPTKTDASSLKGLAGLGKEFARVRAEANPELDLLGVLLYGVTLSATRIQAEARASIAEAFGSAANQFTTTIRHAEGAATPARNAGKLFHELEADVANATPWWELRRQAAEARQRAEAAGEPAPQDPPADRRPSAASAPKLAADFQALAEEVLFRIASAESSPRHAHLVEEPAK